MVLDSPDLAGMANVAVRALQHQVRQTTSSVISSAIASPTTTPLASSSSLLPSSTSIPPPASTSDGSGNGNNNNNNNNNTSGSSPLLFFVALGFGVVFTNLWIIVGVKYCFRYNARNRNMRMTGEDGEPINLENMPQHPRRRRREKKLMTIDEVNEKFPMMKYKSWVASRAQEGLPTQGGISHPPSRAASLADADGIIPVTKERESTEDRPATSGASITTSPTREEPTPEHAEKPATAANGDGERQSADAAAAATAGTSLARTDTPGTDDEHEEDDDQIHDALPPEALESSGDTCAICIDTLEDDDDVRGLTCGHAFHAGCLDPWLISRRACCPLCKADYYTPKPRPAPAEGGPHPEMGPTVSINQDPRTNRMNMPSRPGVAWALPGRRGRVGFPSWNRRRDAPPTQSPTEPRTSNSRRPQQSGFMSRAVTGARGQSRSSGQNASETTENQSGGFMSNIRMPRFNLPGRSTQSNPSNTAAEVTPSDLEAGTRTDAAR